MCNKAKISVAQESLCLGKENIYCLAQGQTGHTSSLSTDNLPIQETYCKTLLRAWPSLKCHNLASETTLKAETMSLVTAEEETFKKSGTVVVLM